MAENPHLAALISDLYETLEEQPSSVDIHERLLEAWQELRDEEMASGAASTLVQLDPNNKVAWSYLNGKESGTPQRSSRNPLGIVAGTDTDTIPSHESSEDWTSIEKGLERGYGSLKLEAEILQKEFEAIYALEKGVSTAKDEEIITNLQAISDGHISAIVGLAQPLSVRERARAIMTTPKKCQELIVEDFEAIVHWAENQEPPFEPDAIRERLVKRKRLLDAALPQSMGQYSTAALARIELEKLKKKYVNSETMLGDRIEDISKKNFFVSEDNYAWDMEELAQAIASHDGVMRNPLTKQLFSESDIRMILAHPLGQRLKPMRLQQNQLKKGIRPTTIDWIEKLGRILLADQTADNAPSRQAMDEFQAYSVTLPETEQKTINLLKIPARDRNSGQPYDYTIGESVKDAVANTTCLHKVIES